MTKAIGVTEYGGPEKLVELDVPEEEISQETLRIRVVAATVNPTDTAIRNGGRGGDRPAGVADVPGMDCSGVLEEIGGGVQTDLQVGDSVMGIVLPDGPHGAYREDIVLPASSVTRAPVGATDIEAATLPMNGLTARTALDQLGLRPGQTIAVTGAAGAFGGYVVQLAKADGLMVIADAAAKDHKLVRGLGADVVLPRGADFANHVRKELPDGVDGLADGALLGSAALPAVADAGAVATVRGYRGDGRRGLQVRPVMVFEHAEDWKKLDRLREQAEQGQITLRVADTYPATEAAVAHRRFEEGGVRGRLVLTFE
jgi:NADPH:quinone reductase-like Zn-dependent oxidoreductase